MDQKELEDRVKKLFQDQGFDVRQVDGIIHVSGDGFERDLQVFSSDYSLDEAASRAEPGALIFVDEGLEQLHYRLDNEVSVISDDDEQEYNLPSYEIIGKVAVVNELSGRDRDEVVEGILHHNSQVETVLLKQEPLSGEFRVGGYEKLYGGDTETTHKEFGCRYRVDPTRAYFSERLATERKRVVDQIRDCEKVLVIGAGVGPYPVLAARKSGADKIVAVEKNPEAFRFLEENIELNSVEDTVEAVKGDIRDVPVEQEFDRVIIAIPESGEEFLELAFRHLNQNGVIHYYRFREDGNWEELLDEIRDAAEKTGTEYSIKNKVICGHRGPSVERVCIEIRRK